MAPLENEQEQFVRETVRRLRELAFKYRGEGNQKRSLAASRAARKLDEWWKKGGQGKVPVDLSEFGMEEAAAVFASWAKEENAAIPVEENANLAPTQASEPEVIGSIETEMTTQFEEPLREEQPASRMADLQHRINEMLQRESGVDIQAMEKLVREAESSVEKWREEGLLDSDAGRSLEASLQELRNRFEKNREFQGRHQVPVRRDYYEIANFTAAMEAALRQGEYMWWDDGSGTYRPIPELLDEMRARLPELAREVALRHYKKAEAALEVHRPKEAQEEVEQGLALESLPPDVRSDLEALQVKVRAELEKWEKEHAEQVKGGEDKMAEFPPESVVPTQEISTSQPPVAESIPVEGKEHIDLGRRWVDALWQMLRQGKHEEAYAKAAEALKSELPEAQYNEIKKIRDEARTNLVAQWMAKANEAYQDKRWEEALNWVRKVLQVEPDYADAERLRQEANERLQRSEHLQSIVEMHQRISEMLQRETGVDIQAMEQLVREAEASVGEWREEGLLDSDVGRSLEASLRELRARFDKKREYQGSKTTAEAAKIYESVVEAIPAMEVALRRGEETWWDDRSGTYRPIPELLDEMRARLPELARDVALRHYKKAEAALEVHRPKEAQEEVEQGLALESLPPDVRSDLEALQVKVRAELEKWEKAEALLQQSAQESSTPKRWSLLRQAKEVYPEHPDVTSALERALEDVIAWAEGEIADELSTVNALIEQDKFQEAYRILNRLRTTVKKLGLPGDEAGELFQKIDEGEETVKAAEERRQAIRALAAKIRDLLRQGEVSQAREVYLGALASHSDWEDDRDFGPLGDEIRAKLGDRERLEEGRRLYERGEWEKARQTIAPITSAELAPEVEKLKAAIAVAEAVAEIQALWERGYYYETLKRIDGVLTSRGESLSEKDRRRLEEYKAEIEQRRDGDQDVWLALGKVGLRSFEVLSNETAWNKEIATRLSPTVEGFSEAVRIHHVLIEALKVHSTLEGYLRDAEGRLEAWVRRYGKQIIEGLKEEGKWNLVREWLDIWTKNWRHLERNWRKNLYRAYFEHRARQLEHEEAWDDLVDMWGEAQSILPDVFEFVSKEKEARRRRILAKARAGLSSGRPEDTREVIAILEDEREVWNDTVRAVHYLANRLYDLDSKLEMGQLEGIEVFRNGILDEWQRQEDGRAFLPKEMLEEILKRRFVLAAEKFLKRGDEARESNPQESLISYARGLQLPLPPEQREILQKRVESFGHLSQRYVVDLAQALNQVQVVNTRPLIEQLEIVKTQRMQALALIGVLPVIIPQPQERERWERSLHEGVLKSERVIDALEEALNVLDRYKEGGEEWASVLREGQWSRVEQDISSAVKKMNTTPPELTTLRQRVEKARAQRGELINLRKAADMAYQKEEFEAGMRAINAIRKIVAGLGATPDTDPFGVVQRMQVFDLETSTMVEGVDAVYKLLEERAANAQAWEKWRDELEEEQKVLRPQVENLTHWPDPDPTAREVDLLDAALHKCQAALDKAAAPPAESPMSDRARKAKDEGEKINYQLQEWHLWLKQRRKERWIDMGTLMQEAYDLVNAGNIEAANALISQGLHYQPEHEFLNFLQRRINEVRSPSRGFLERFLGR